MDYKIKKNSGATRRTAGFTLIETLFAVLILGLTIVGPLSIAAKGLHLARISKDQTTAYYMAQDAVEYIHFARDTNCLVSGSSGTGCSPVNWLVGNGNPTQTINLIPCISPDGSISCYLDSLSQNPTSPSLCVGVCPVLYYDPINKNYTYATVSGLVPTIFTRTITIQSPRGANDCIGTDGCEALLTVKITWKDAGGRGHNVVVYENIFNWE